MMKLMLREFAQTKYEKTISIRVSGFRINLAKLLRQQKITT
jgi:hypothetical protein